MSAIQLLCLAVIYIFGPVFVYVILFKCIRMLKKYAKNPEEVTSLISVKQKNLIFAALAFMYLAVFVFAVFGEGSIIAGIRAGALMALFYTLRPISQGLYLCFGLILYQDKKIREQKRLSAGEKTDET